MMATMLEPAIDLLDGAAAACAHRPGGLALTDEALRLCPLPAGASVLDLGCGSSGTVAYLRARYGLAAFGLDRSSSALLAGPRGHLLEATAERLPAASGRLDAVLAECSLSTMSDPSAALAECARVLKPGGALIVTDVYARNPAGLEALRRLPPETGLSGARSQGDIVERVTSGGFRVTLWQDRSEVLKPLAVQLIWSQSSLAPAGGQGDDLRGLERAIALGRPGYYLLLAAKGDE